MGEMPFLEKRDISGLLGKLSELKFANDLKIEQKLSSVYI